MDKIQISIAFYFVLLTSFGQLRPYQDTSKFVSSGQTEIASIPEIPAKFPGGHSQMTKFVTTECMKTMTISKAEAAVYQQPAVKWIVDEKGSVKNAQIIRTSNISRIDQTLIQTIQKMPRWTPAQFQGKPVEQDCRFLLRLLFK